MSPYRAVGAKDKILVPIGTWCSSQDFGLVVLVPSGYYEELVRRLATRIDDELGTTIVADLTTLSFYPGFLRPEDLVTKTLREMEHATL